MDKLLISILALLVVVTIWNPLANPIADMYGPYFLLFYAFVSGVTIVICGLSIHSSDQTANLPLPLVPANPDPYEIAYMRGGENEVIRLALLNLTGRGYLQIAGDRLEKARNHPDPLILPVIERDVFRWFVSSHKAQEIFQSSLPATVKQHCTVYEQHLQNEKLLRPDETKQIAQRVSWKGVLIILGLGSYKLVVALAKGYTNVVFLIVLGIVSLITLAVVCKPLRLSQRGQGYLKRLQQTFESLKSQASILHPSGTDFGLLLPVAIFGVGMLSATPYAEFEKMFHLSAASGGGGCGGDSGGCGAGCGGGCGGGCAGCGGG